MTVQGSIGRFWERTRIEQETDRGTGKGSLHQRASRLLLAGLCLLVATAQPATALASEGDLEGSAELRLWQTESLVTIAIELLAEGDYELAQRVLAAGSERLRATEATPLKIDCPGSPGASGVYLPPIKRSLWLAYVLVDEADGAQTRRLLQAVVPALAGYSRFVRAPRAASVTELREEMENALDATGPSQESATDLEAAPATPLRPRGATDTLTSETVWSWLARVEGWCRRSPSDRSGARPGAEK